MRFLHKFQIFVSIIFNILVLTIYMLLKDTFIQFIFIIESIISWAAMIKLKENINSSCSGYL